MNLGNTAATSASLIRYALKMLISDLIYKSVLGKVGTLRISEWFFILPVQFVFGCQSEGQLASSPAATQHVDSDQSFPSIEVFHKSLHFSWTFDYLDCQHFEISNCTFFQIFYLLVNFMIKRVYY